MTESGPDRAAAKSARYSTVAIVLHWAIAALIVLQVVLAGRMEGPRTPETFAVTQLHKSIGVTVLLLTVLRVAWRLAKPPPPEPPTLAPWERRLSQAVHAAFYLVMIGMPLTGWIMVSTSRIALPTLLYGAVPWPNIPGLGDLAPAAKTLWHEAAETGHGAIIKLAYVLLALHVAGALKHQVLSRDEPILARMAPGAVPGRRLEPRLLAIAAAFAGVIVVGRMVQPPRPHMAPAAAVTPVAEEPAEAQAPNEPAAPPAAAPAAPAVVATPAAATPWKVLPGSALGFTTAWSGEAIQGRFDRWTADIVFSPDDLAHSRVTVSIDMASVNTGDAQRDQSLPAFDWFDTESHPKATFTATRFEAAGPNRYVARGTLALRGVSRPLSLPFKLTIDGDRARASGVTSLDRTVFGVGQGEWTSTDQIPAKVTVRVDLKARRTSP